MSYSSLLQLKPLLMVLAAAGSVTSGVMVNSFAPHKDPATFILGLNPSSIFLAENATSTSTVSIASIDGFSGTVTLSVSFQGPTITATVNPASVNVVASGVATSTLSVKAPTTQGNYNIVVTGMAINHGKTSYSASMLTVQVVSSQDFTITSAPSSIPTTTGTTNTATITVTSVNAYSGNVSLTVTAPFGYITVTGGQNPLIIVSGGSASSTLAITTSVNTADGNYSIIVTGTDGSRSHSTTITLKVVDPIPVVVESLVLNSYHFNNSTSLTLVLLNTGNGTITLVSYIVRDSQGNAWSLTSWAGPSIAINTASSANILIGSSCQGCIYTGIAGIFLQFHQGQTYTVTLTTSRNNQFTFTEVA